MPIHRTFALTVTLTMGCGEAEPPPQPRSAPESIAPEPQPAAKTTPKRYATVLCGRLPRAATLRAGLQPRQIRIHALYSDGHITTTAAAAHYAFACATDVTLADRAPALPSSGQAEPPGIVWLPARQGVLEGDGIGGSAVVWLLDRSWEQTVAQSSEKLASAKKDQRPALCDSALDLQPPEPNDAIADEFMQHFLRTGEPQQPGKGSALDLHLQTIERCVKPPDG